jgi:hypothetical protein
MFQPALGHQLHADANAKKRRPGLDPPDHRRLQPVHRGKPGGAIREGALAGQHDPVRFRHHLRVRGDPHIRRDPPPLRRQRQAARRRSQIAAIIVDDRDEN